MKLDRIYRFSNAWANTQYERFCGPSSVQASVIISAISNGRILQSYITTRLGLGKSGSSKIIGKLVADGYLKRRSLRKDARAYMLYPTQKARSVYPQLIEIQNALKDKLLDGVSATEQEQVYSFLTQIAENAQRLSCAPFEPIPKVEYRANKIPNDPENITPEQWAAMKAVDIRTVDKTQLVELHTVIIDESLPPRERELSFIRQIKNPYCFLVGGVAVKLTYQEDGPTFEELFTAFIRRELLR